MVVCKFFQQGNCRYGQNCRFEHIYGSKYTYTAPSHQPASAPLAVTDEQLINQVQSEVTATLRGGQWILSSYAPFKEKPAFPGFSDLSPEEARLIIYEAKANNTLDQAVAYMNNLVGETRQKYEQLLQKNPNITQIFRRLYQGENVASPFGNSQGNGASSVFRSAVNNSAFGNTQTPSIFSQNSFGNQSDPAKSLFAQATQNVFSSTQNQSIFSTQPTQNQSPFNQAQATAQSIFAQASQTINQTPAFNQSSPPVNQSNQLFGLSSPTNQPFGQSSQTNQPFGQSSQTNQPFGQPNQPFGQPSQTQPSSIFAQASQSIFGSPQQPSNVFQQNKNVFDMNQNVFQAQSQGKDETGVYSKLEDLTKEDLEAFNSEDFKMGFVPEVPPPQSLCF